MDPCSRIDREVAGLCRNNGGNYTFTVERSRSRRGSMTMDGVPRSSPDDPQSRRGGVTPNAGLRPMPGTHEVRLHHPTSPRARTRTNVPVHSVRQGDPATRKLKVQVRPLRCRSEISASEAGAIPPSGFACLTQGFPSHLDRSPWRGGSGEVRAF